MKAVCLWSAGKDSCFAYYKAKLQGHDIISLFNFVELNAKNSLSHGLKAEVIQKQAAMLEVPFLQKPMSKKTYRQEFKSLMNKWKEKEKIEGIVFGDIYLQEHKDWIDKVCGELELTAILPLWDKNTKDLIVEFIVEGFKAIIVSLRADILDKDWLGRIIDKVFVEEINTLGNIDPCGEKGEFHTFVFDGPVFKKSVEYVIGRKVLKDRHWFLEIT